MRLALLGMRSIIESWLAIRNTSMLPSYSGSEGPETESLEVRGRSATRALLIMGPMHLGDSTSSRRLAEVN